MSSNPNISVFGDIDQWQRIGISAREYLEGAGFEITHIPRLSADMQIFSFRRQIEMMEEGEAFLGIADPVKGTVPHGGIPLFTKAQQLEMPRLYWGKPSNRLLELGAVAIHPAHAEDYESTTDIINNWHLYENSPTRQGAQ